MTDPVVLADVVRGGACAAALGVSWFLAEQWAGVFASDATDGGDGALGAAVPVAALAIGAIGGARSEATLGLALSLAAAGVLLAVAVIDARTRMIPIVAVAALAALGIARAGFGVDLPAALLGGLAGFALFWLLWAAARLARSRSNAEPFGSGDILLASGIGVVAGWPAVLGTLFLGAVFGAIYAAWLVVGRSRAAGHAFPYGTFLCLAAIWVLMLGG